MKTDNHFTRRIARALFATGILLASALGIPPVFAQTDADAKPDPMADARYVGEKRCVGCHQVENKHFGHTTHAKVFRENPKSEAEKHVCEACHGPGSKHSVEKDNKNTDYLISFTKEWGTPVEKQNAQCLNCHKGGQRLHWGGSAHDSSKIACSDCHNPMARFSATGLLKKASITETCETCHQQQRAEFRKRSHMPVPEGKMSCGDCHNPHGSVTKPLMKAKSVNEVCYACHAEKRGPLIWEHSPVRENCMNCHNAHGSNHDKLLQSARPYLCLQCHDAMTGHPAGLYQNAQTATYVGINPATGLPFSTSQTAPNVAAFNVRTEGRSCQNCHVQIHGSNHVSGSRFQR